MAENCLEVYGIPGTYKSCGKGDWVCFQGAFIPTTLGAFIFEEVPNVVIFSLRKRKKISSNFSCLCVFSKETQQDSFRQEPYCAAHRAELRSAKTSQ